MGRAKDLIEKFSIDEKVTVSMVDSFMGKYIKRLEAVLKEANKYQGSKWQRRLESDYAGNEKKLGEIGSVVMESTEQVEESLKNIKKIVG